MSQLTARLKQAVVKANPNHFIGELNSADAMWLRTGWKVAKTNRRAWRKTWNEAHPDIPLAGPNDNNPPAPPGGGGRGGGSVRPDGAHPPRGGVGTNPTRRGASRRRSGKKNKSSLSGDALAYAAFAPNISDYRPLEISTEHLLRRATRPFGLGGEAIILNLPSERFVPDPKTGSLSVLDAQKLLRNFANDAASFDHVEEVGDDVRAITSPHSVRFSVLGDLGVIVTEGLSPEAIESLKADGIDVVANNENNWAFAASSPPGTEQSNAQPMDTWAKDWIAVTDTSRRGKDVIIGQIDSGIYREHAEFANSDIKISQRSGNPKPFAVSWEYDTIRYHGTACAAAAIGLNVGIAPEAKLIVAPTFDYRQIDGKSKLSASLVDILGSLDRIVRHARSIQKPLVLALPFTLPQANEGERAFKDILRKLQNPKLLDGKGRFGCVVVAASGNDHPEVPARPFSNYQRVIGVGSHDRKGVVARFSAGGVCIDCPPGTSKPDFTSPGTELWLPHGTGYAETQGSSFSTMFLTGLIAALISDDPSLSVDTQRLYKELIERSARIIDPYYICREGHGSPQFVRT